MVLVLLVLFYLFSPILILYLCHRFPFVNRLGAVVVAYLLGVLIGNSGIFPQMGASLNEFLLMEPDSGIGEVSELYESGHISGNELLAYKIYQLRDTLMSITILLAIPLVLFSVQLRQWKAMAGKTMLSLFIGLFSVVSIIVAGYFIFDQNGTEEMWKVSGMLVGVYTGGTPNLASLKIMLDVDANTYILTHTYDLIIGLVYLAFLITIGQKIFLRFLPAHPASGMEITSSDQNRHDVYWGVLRRKTLVPLLKAYLVALLILGLSAIIALIVPDHLRMVSVILSITSFGLLASIIPGINKTEKTFESGMYLILIFSLVVSSMANVRDFSGITAGLFFYISLAVFGSLLLHLLIARLFRIDADTVIITSTAMICSPPFVPVVASALRNREVVVPGLTIGIIGYAVGNYLGFLVANILRGL
jgi:uncharacterized membrane protein